MDVCEFGRNVEYIYFVSLPTLTLEHWLLRLLWEKFYLGKSCSESLCATMCSESLCATAEGRGF
jgi:hypothetical protein